MTKHRIFNIIILLLLVFSLAAKGSNNVAAAPGPTDETKVPHYFGPYPNWATSPMMSPDVAVTINGVGSGASATATVGANGAVTGITITNPGSGYDLTTTVTIAPVTGTGSGATADAVVTTTNAVTAISVDVAGGGYSAPVVVISGGGATIDATATVYGGVDAVALSSVGAGYTMPLVDFDMPDGPGGVQASAHAMCTGPTVDVPCSDATAVQPLVITSIAVDNPGSGYSFAPKVKINDGPLFAPINQAAKLAAAVRAEAQRTEVAGRFSSGSINAPSFTSEALGTATLTILSVELNTFGAGYTGIPSAVISDTAPGIGTGAFASALTNGGAVTAINLTAPGSGYISGTGIRKFVDSLPGIGPLGANNLGQYIPVAVADQTTFPGADYYEIAVVEYQEQMHSDLPPTKLRGYVQVETSVIQGIHYSLPGGKLGVDKPHYLGPTIVAQKDRPVRITFYNLLPTGAAGDLFLPTDSTIMGSGMLPENVMDPMDMGMVTDEVRNPMCTDYPKLETCFPDNRATLHLHGGNTPWISDGTAHQWITPSGEATTWPQGVSVQNVPDMVGATRPAGVPDCSLATDGCQTFYYTNQQSARLLFYHDHSWGITRLNVYAGEAAGYLIQDPIEQGLVSAGVIPADIIPLVIQDRTFVPSPAQLAEQDPTWDTARWGGQGQLWYHHVYMPAQNPGDPGGMSAYGRWMYGPWFWPPAGTAKYQPIANPYFDMDPLGPDGIRGTTDDFTTKLAVPCSLDIPATWQYQVDPFCEPAQIPATPNISVGMEQFNDTPLVNGTAYPTTTLQPRTYRFRILNAANDRFWNLQWYVGDPSTASTALNNVLPVPEAIGATEVALNEAEVAAAQLDPVVFPTPDLSNDGGTDPSFSLAGPDWVQIGTEGGFLPAPTVVNGHQVTTWITDPTRFDVGNVDLHSLVLAPAERGDVIVDFSKFAGQTLILYNDAPAAYPARVPSYDYYTGYPDQSPNGPAMILPGYGPNTRTIMQVKIAAAPAAPAFNVTALKSAFLHKADGSGVFEKGQHPIIVGQAAYNSAYGKSFAAAGDCTYATTASTTKCDGFARINQQGKDLFTFDTLRMLANGTYVLPNSKVQVKIEPKAIHDEMNSSSFDEYGRMTANIGLEVVPANPAAQNIVLYPFVNPPTELIDVSNLPKYGINVSPISIGTDGTQIWKITHNGVDTHPIHWHMYDVQLLNRVTWDNIIIPPEASELGWKDTLRISPLEDTIVALRPIVPQVPFELPNNIRMLNPSMPAGDTSMFNNIDADGNPTAPIVNQLVNFGWEFTYHCHILSHEEMDMMRPVAVAAPPVAPSLLAFVVTGTGNNKTLTFTWNDNSITETSFILQRTSDNVNWTNVTTIQSPLNLPNTHGARSFSINNFQDTVTPSAYRVVAVNTIGYGGAYMSLSVQSQTAPIAVLLAPSGLSAQQRTGRQIRLTWTDNSRNENGFYVERSVNGGPFTVISNSVPPRNNTGSVTYTDSLGLAVPPIPVGAALRYRVQAWNALGTSAYSPIVNILAN